MKKIKLAIADDHLELHQAVTLLLNTQADFEIVLHAENGLDLLEKLEIFKPDIVLMDIKMPKMNGIEATDKVLEQYPEIKIIAFSLYDNEANIVDMYLHGVKSFIGKEDPNQELFKAIRIVYDGGAYMTELSISIVQKHLTDISKNHNSQFDNHLVMQLSDAELKVLWHTCQHKSIKEIAEALFVSHHTVNNHHYNIRHKLNIQGRSSLLRYALSIKERLIMVDGKVKVKK
jgi:DNA-binding NarL/FixJ family response regulator